MKVRTQLKAGRATAVAVGALSLNFGSQAAANVVSAGGSITGGTISQSITQNMTQTATSTNSGAVTANATNH